MLVFVAGDARRPIRPTTPSASATLVDGLDEVQEAYSLTGEADYLVKLAVPDLKALSRILNEVFLPHGSVAHVRSSVVLDRLKQTAGCRSITCALRRQRNRRAADEIRSLG